MKIDVLHAFADVFKMKLWFRKSSLGSMHVVLHAFADVFKMKPWFRKSRSVSMHVPLPHQEGILGNLCFFLRMHFDLKIK